MRPYLEIFSSGAVWTYTRPSQRLIFVSSFSTALSSYDLPFENMTTRVLSARIALRSGFGSPFRSSAGVAAAPAWALPGCAFCASVAEPAADSPASTPSTLSCCSKLAVGGVDGVLRRVAHLTGLADGRPGRRNRRDLLGLGPEEEHVDAHHRDSEDEDDSDRRGDLAHDHAYRHVSRES